MPLVGFRAFGVVLGAHRQPVLEGHPIQPLLIHRGEQVVDEIRLPAAIGLAVLQKPLAGTGVVDLAHIPAGRLVGEALAAAGEPLGGPQHLPRGGADPRRVDGLHILPRREIGDHPLFQGQLLVFLGGGGKAPAKAAAGHRVGDKRPKVGEGLFLLQGRGDELVDVVDAGEAAAQGGHLPHLLRPGEHREIDHIPGQHPLGAQVGGVGVSPQVVGHRAAVGVHLNAPLHPVGGFCPRRGEGGDAGVQPVHLHHLEAEAILVRDLQDQDPAIHKAAADDELQHLGEGEQPPDVAVLGAGPPFPQLLHLGVKRFVLRPIGPEGFGLQLVAGAHHVADHGVDEAAHHIAVALQIPGPGPDDVPAAPVGGLGPGGNGGPAVGGPAGFGGAVKLAQRLPGELPPQGPPGIDPAQHPGDEAWGKLLAHLPYLRSSRGAKTLPVSSRASCCSSRRRSA